MIKTLGQRKLGRTPSHRTAMLRNMATSLLLHEHVSTSVAKAKELKAFTDRVITQAKRGEHAQVRRTIQSKTVYRKLFEVLAPRYAERPGGFTQTFRLERRRGDNSEMALVKLIS